jgi:hypothetical protein
MKRRKILILLLSVFVVAATILYFWLFFQKGIIFEDSFLKLSHSDDEIRYSGSAYGEDIEIRLQDTSENSDDKIITYTIGDWYDKTYRIKVINITEVNMELKIYEDNSLVFEGTYDIIGDSALKLWDKKGEPVWDFRVTFNNQSPLDKSYVMGYSQIVSTALQDNVILRGNWMLVIFAVIILIITAIDIKWPLFFFRQKYAFSVRNPEPSELYLEIQKVCWVVMPTIAVIILIVSLLAH